MPLRLDVRKRLCSRSDRVKSIDLHPTEPWICASLYNGNVHIWNIESQQLIKTFEVCSSPVRAVRFVARKNWVITASDDMFIRIYNYNTLERIHQFEAHSDYIRSIVVHPTQPFIITSSDDMLIRLWDWEKNWSCAPVFEGHTHYVMQLVINPKDNNTFASASLDKTVKVWSLSSSQANFTLEGHERGVNCIGYHPSPDKPYIASGSDDRTVRVWDYQTKLCVQVLEGHAQNISSLAFHPDVPIILTGSEDGTVRLWHSNTYRLESTLNYGLERVWTVTCHQGSQQVGIGYDEGTIVISLGREDPAMSMDSSGKLVCARHAELVQSNIRSITAALGNNVSGSAIEDGTRLPIVYKDMGACEIYPQTLAHNANGKFVVVCGDGEYIVYTAMALRNRMFGQALEFVWSQSDPSMYAVLESNTTFKIFKNFKELKSFKMNFGSDHIFGGHLLGVRSVAGLAFYDWPTGKLLRRIDVSAKAVYWADGGQLVAICTKDCFYILRYHPEVIVEAEASGTIENDPDGVEAAFEVIQDGEVKESVKTGCWFGDAFLFTNAANRLMYYVGGELVTVAHLERPMYLLGYLANENRVFLGDRDLQVVAFTLLLTVLEYETAVLRRDFAAADSILPSIPVAHRTKIAHFLERQGFRQQAMRVTTDPDHKFELALQLNDLKTAHDLIKDVEDVESNETKWHQLADIAVKESDFKLAQECFSKTRDYASFLLIATSSGDDQMVSKLAKQTSDEEIDNLAFLSLFLLSDLEGCIKLLIKAQRYPEAAFFARSYLPSRVPETVELWRKWLKDEHKAAKTAEALANPTEYANLFPGWDASLEVERWLQSDRASRRLLLASDYLSQKPLWERNPATEMLNTPPPVSNSNTIVSESPFEISDMNQSAVQEVPSSKLMPPPSAPLAVASTEDSSSSVIRTQRELTPPASPSTKVAAGDPISDLINMSAPFSAHGFQLPPNFDQTVTSILDDDTDALAEIDSAFSKFAQPRKPTSSDHLPPFDPFEMPHEVSTDALWQSEVSDPLLSTPAAPFYDVAASVPSEFGVVPGNSIPDFDGDDFDAELEHQLATFNLEPATIATSSDKVYADWDDDDESFGDPEN